MNRTKRFEFWRLHIPTGRREGDWIGAADRAQFLGLLDAWNGLNPGIYQYWSK